MKEEMKDMGSTAGAVPLPPAQPSREQRMYDALRRIAREYQTPDQLRRSCSRDYGLAAQEAIEMAYENIQTLAAYTIRGMRRPK